MFTGIVQALGKVTGLEEHGGDVVLTIESAELALDTAELGDSIAVNGVCLTVTDKSPALFCADVSVETLNATTLKHCRPGSPVNLEKAVLANQALGGHLVSGHVDGVGRVASLQADARSTRFVIQAPAGLNKYIAPKGSITIDGVSLTVNEVSNHGFGVNIIPHTSQQTLFHTYQVGSEVNLEVDLIARYVERLLTSSQEQEGVSYQLLKDNGFA